MTQMKGEGATTVTTSGTAVQIGAPDIICDVVLITASADNTGVIYVGTSTVNAATGEGSPLPAGANGTFPARDLNDIFIDSTENGDSVSYTYYEN